MYGSIARSVATVGGMTPQEMEAVKKTERMEKAFTNFRRANDASAARAAQERQANQAVRGQIASNLQGVQQRLQESADSQMGGYAARANAQADAMAQRGAAIDARTAALQDAPTSYNGITLSPAARIANANISPQRQELMDQHGYQVVDGVVRKVRQSAGGGSVAGNQPNPAPQGIGYGNSAQTAQELAAGGYGTGNVNEDAARIYAARQRYGLDSPNQVLPRGAIAMIQARTDLTDEQKAAKIASVEGMREANRQKNLQRAQMRAATKQQRAQEQANAAQMMAQQQQLAMLSQAAAMGNPAAAEALGQIARSQAFNNQAAMQGNLGMAEIQSRENIAKSVAEQRAREMEAEQGYRTEDLRIKGRELEIEAERNKLIEERSNAATEQERREIDARIAGLDVEREKMQFELDQAKENAGKQDFDRNEVAGRLIESGMPPGQAYKSADSIEALRNGPPVQGTGVESIRQSTLEEGASQDEIMGDALGRLNEKFRFIDGSELPPLENIEWFFTINGIDIQDMERYARILGEKITNSVRPGAGITSAIYPGDVLPKPGTYDRMKKEYDILTSIIEKRKAKAKEGPGQEVTEDASIVNYGAGEGPQPSVR